MIPDFQNFSPQKMKELIAQYQQERKPEQWYLILAKYDRYLIHVINELTKSWYHLQTEDPQDLYQTSILGFHKGILAFKPHLDPSLLIPVIKAYIKSEIKQNYRHRQYETLCADPPEQESLDLKSKISSKLFFNSIMSSKKLTDEDKEILKMRFQADISIEDIAKRYNSATITIYKRIERIIEKIRKIALDNII